VTTKNRALPITLLKVVGAAKAAAVELETEEDLEEDQDKVISHELTWEPDLNHEHNAAAKALWPKLICLPSRSSSDRVEKRMEQNKRKKKDVQSH
jgi:hypothetical protein